MTAFWDGKVIPSGENSRSALVSRLCSSCIFTAVSGNRAGIRTALNITLHPQLAHKPDVDGQVDEDEQDAFEGVGLNLMS